MNSVHKECHKGKRPPFYLGSIRGTMMNRKTKIIYLTETPFNQRDYRRYGIDVFINDGFVVHVWDFSPFLFKGWKAPPDPTDYKNWVAFDSVADAVAALRKVPKEAFVISLLRYDRDTRKIFRTMSKQKIDYSIRVDAYPSLEKTAKTIIRKLTRMSPKMIIYHVRNLTFRFFRQMYRRESPTFLFLSAAKSSVDPKRLNHQTKIIRAHAWDYDIYLEKKVKEENGENTIVFMDNYLPFHPHLLYLNLVWAKAEVYYPSLCRLFDYVEQKLDSTVVIAAHPRSHYEDHPDFFQGRKVVRGQSATLVKNAKLVILHGSASAFFPVLFRKPMLFITMDGILKTNFAADIRAFTTLFGKRPLNISKELHINLKDELVVDEAKYAQFQNDFIKAEGSEELPYWQIVKNCIKSL